MDQLPSFNREADHHLAGFQPRGASPDSPLAIEQTEDFLRLPGFKALDNHPEILIGQ